VKVIFLKKMFEKIKEEDLLFKCYEKMNEALCKHKERINKNKRKCKIQPNSNMNHEHTQANNIKK